VPRGRLIRAAQLDAVTDSENPSANRADKKVDHAHKDPNRKTRLTWRTRTSASTRMWACASATFAGEVGTLHRGAPLAIDISDSGV